MLPFIDIMEESIEELYAVFEFWVCLDKYKFIPHIVYLYIYIYYIFPTCICQHLHIYSIAYDTLLAAKKHPGVERI